MSPEIKKASPTDMNLSAMIAPAVNGALLYVIIRWLDGKPIIGSSYTPLLACVAGSVVFDMYIKDQLTSSIQDWTNPNPIALSEQTTSTGESSL